MDHQQLAVRMVCSWGLVKAYQQTRAKCLHSSARRAPNVLEAYNHKVNNDTHKELNLQERAVLQYAHTLQYVSYCNDARYKDRWAPAVKDFWAEVVEPFWNQGSMQFRPSHLLGRHNVPELGG